ncbi:hypothetical protein [Henriciella aquimarina]|uniref:hypothetical protein n=1 Tax=Henriciella aquimarina TaxID=545261 RepID=UPI000A0279C9|nr:hypothetical protein [Henriciella aquimarina]
MTLSIRERREEETRANVEAAHYAARNDAEYAAACFNVAADLAATLIRAGQKDLIPAVIDTYRESIVDEFTDMDVMYEALSDEKVTAAAHGLAHPGGDEDRRAAA